MIHCMIIMMIPNMYINLNRIVGPNEYKPSSFYQLFLWLYSSGSSPSASNQFSLM